MSSGGAKDGKETDGSHLIRLRVENVKDMDSNGKHEVKTINGIPVKLYSYRDGHILRFGIHCENRDYPIWECQVEGVVKLVNQADDSRSILKKVDESLSFDEQYFSQPLADWDEIIENTNNFVVGEAILVEAKICLKSILVNRKLPRIEFFSPSALSDVVLLVEGQKFHVSKAILANASTYFHALFYGNFKESQEKEIELKDISADTFATALEFIYDSVKNMNEDNVEDLLRMAQLLDIPKIMDEAERFLVHSNCLPSHKEFLLADQYNLKIAQNRLLDELGTFEDVADLKNSDSYKHFSKDLMNGIIGQLLKIGAELC